MDDPQLKDGEPYLVNRWRGYEVWAKWYDFDDMPGEGIFTCFASEACDDPIGEADDWDGCIRLAHWWFKDRRS